MRKFLALGAAALLALAVVAPVAATPGVSATTVTVNSEISITSPATIDFGNGAPGAVLAPDAFNVTVTTNNRTGYKVTAQATTLVSSGTADVIQPGAMTLQGGSFASATALTLLPVTAATKSGESLAAGDPISYTASMVVPFVASGAYAGTMTFVAAVNP